MASSMDSTEGESSLVGLPIASDLAFDHVLLPLAGDVPAESGNPVLGSDGGYCTISVTRVVEHLDLALKSLVDPLRTLWLHVVNQA